MSMDDDLKKEQRKGILIVGSGISHSQMVDLKVLTDKFTKQLDQAKIDMIKMGETGVSGAAAGMALSATLRRMEPIFLCPEDTMIMDPHFNSDVDFSKLERIVIDSMTIMERKPTKFAGRYYDESGEISKRTYKKLMKLAKKVDKAEARSHKQNQTDHWCNKWNHKIKRKL